MVQDTGQLAEQGPDELGTLGNLNVQQLLNSKRETLLIGHHGDVIKTVEVRQSLEVGLVLDQLLSTTVQQTDVRVGANNFLAIELENQTQHTVSGGMLRTEVDGVVTDLAVGNGVIALLFRSFDILADKTVGVLRVAKVGIDRQESSAHLGSRISSLSSRRDRSRSSKGCRTKTEPLGPSAGEAGDGSHDTGRMGRGGGDEGIDSSRLKASREPLGAESMGGLLRAQSGVEGFLETRRRRNTRAWTLGVSGSDGGAEAEYCCAEGALANHGVSITGRGRQVPGVGHRHWFSHSLRGSSATPPASDHRTSASLLSLGFKLWLCRCDSFSSSSVVPRPSSDSLSNIAYPSTHDVDSAMTMAGA